MLFVTDLILGVGHEFQKWHTRSAIVQRRDCEKLSLRTIKVCNLNSPCLSFFIKKILQDIDPRVPRCDDPLSRWVSQGFFTIDISPFSNILHFSRTFGYLQPHAHRIERPVHCFYPCHHKYLLFPPSSGLHIPWRLVHSSPIWPSLALYYHLLCHTFPGAVRCFSGNFKTLHHFTRHRWLRFDCVHWAANLHLTFIHVHCCPESGTEPSWLYRQPWRSKVYCRRLRIGP